MRVLLALLLVPALAGCADPPPAADAEVPVLEVGVDTRANTTLAFGEVLGSTGGRVVHPFRFDNATTTVVVPEGTPPAGHFVAVRQVDERPALLADSTRATVQERDELPSILEVEPRFGGRFGFEVVQAPGCRATVNHGGEVSDGVGPFRVPDLAAGDWVVVVFEGDRTCPDARFEARNLGLWKVREI